MPSKPISTKSPEEKSMSKRFVILILIVILVVIALGIWIGVAISSSGSAAANPNAPSAYSAVYLTTGDIYFGKLSWFPSPHLTDVWFLERGQDQSGQTQLGVAPFNSVFWGPVDAINLDAKQIVFWTSLKNGSELVQAMENPSSATPTATSSLPVGVPMQAATSSR